MNIEGVEYEFIRASDLHRDGMSLECYRVGVSGERQPVLEAFWHDPTGRFVAHLTEGEVPFALVREFVRRASEFCPPTQAVEPGTRTLIYVPLLNEGIAVWRPVGAKICAEGLFRIMDAQPDGERWAFPSGTTVRCSRHRFDDGTSGLVARARADD